MIKIYTDSCSDIPITNLPKDLEILPLHYYFEGENIEYGEKYQLNMRDFFEKIEQGKIPHTSSVNPEFAINRFLDDILSGNDIICICASSSLSSTYQNVSLAAKQLKQEYPSSNITVIDSLTGSLAEGLLVLKANSLKQEKKSYQEIIDYIENYKKYYQINFFVNDLTYLQRGGRISKTACAIGTTLGIRPLIHVNYEGQAEQVLNSRGVKKCDHILIQKLIDEVDLNESIGIVHSDDLVSAQRLLSQIEKLDLSCPIVLGEISPTIATHIGPNAYGLTYKVKSIKKNL